MNFAAAIRQIIQQIFGMSRFRWQALGLAWLIALAGWLYVMTLPNEYMSFARVYVDTENALKPLLRGLAVQVDTMSQVNLMTRALLSRPELEAVASETGLINDGMTAGQIDLVLTKMGDQISIKQMRRQSIFDISYRNTSAARAYRVVQTILNNFVSKSLSGDRTETEQAQRFLKEQLALYEQRLTEAEKRLADFKKENVGLMPGQDGGYFTRLQQAETEVNRLKRLVNSAEERRRVLTSQLKGETETNGTDQAKLGTSVDQTIASFELQLNEMLLKYTEKHPDVISIRETLKDLYKLRDAEQNALSEQGGFDPVLAAANPVYQQLRVALSDTEVELAGLKSDLAEKQERVTYLRSMVDTIPEVEARLNRLNRDYDVVKAQYQTLLERLESAKLAEEVQEDSDQVTFDVIEPPRVPLVPVAPDRTTLSFLVLVMALAIGVGLAFMLNQSRQTFYSARELANFSRLPVYGTINLTASAAHQRVGGRLLFVVCTLSLFVVFAGIAVWGNLLIDRLNSMIFS